MRPIEQAIAREGRQDRAEVFAFDDPLSGAEGLVVVADGAGGTSNGAAAAEALVAEVRRLGWRAHSADWMDAIDRVDRAGAAGGQTTAIVFSVRSNGLLSGACVGDSAAWWFSGSRAVELTEGSRRKPLVGTGEAVVVGLSLEAPEPGTLVVATDGLWKYAELTAIQRTLQLPPAQAAPALIELVRLPGGGLQDDVAVVVCRLGPQV